MTREEKRDIAHIIRRETGCGMMEATAAIEKLIEALKRKPLTVKEQKAETIVSTKVDISDITYMTEYK